MDLRARMRVLRAECERVRVPDHLGDRERDDVADVAALRGCARSHAGEVDRFLASTEVLGHVRQNGRARRHLELDVGMLLRRRRHRGLEPERRREDDLVPVADQAVDHLGDLRSLGDVLLESCLDFAAERLLHHQASLVMCLRPAAVVVRTHVDPRCLEGRALTRSARRSADGERCDDRSQHAEDCGERKLPLGHDLLSRGLTGGETRL